MSWKLCEWSDTPQRWAIFDTIVDRFIIWDATIDEIRDEFLKVERRRAEDGFERFINRPPAITRGKGMEIQEQRHGPIDMDLPTTPDRDKAGDPT